MENTEDWRELQGNSGQETGSEGIKSAGKGLAKVLDWESKLDSKRILEVDHLVNLDVI